MPITVVCHKCGTLATVPDSAAGMQGKCERCGNVIHVPGGTKKTCCVCRADVSGAKRTKDVSGNYYCAACWAAQNVRSEPSTAVAGSTVEAVVASPESVPDAPEYDAPRDQCVICGEKVPIISLSSFAGDLACGACSAKHQLGTIPYQLNKGRAAIRVIFNCPSCQGDLESTLEGAGKEDYCPQCGATFATPGRYEYYKVQRRRREIGLAPATLQQNLEGTVSPRAAGTTPDLDIQHEKGNDMRHQSGELCVNCQGVIGGLETPCLWGGRVVCPECFAKLNARGNAGPTSGNGGGVRPYTRVLGESLRAGGEGVPNYRFIRVAGGILFGTGIICWAMAVFFAIFALYISTSTHSTDPEGKHVASVTHVASLLWGGAGVLFFYGMWSAAGGQVLFAFRDIAMNSWHARNRN